MAERSGFFSSFKILLCLLLRKTHLQLSYDSNTTINAVGCEAELTFNGEKIISHANQTNVQKNKSCLGCQSAADLTAQQMKKRKALRNKMSNKLSQRNKKKKVQDELSKASLLTYIYFVNSISEASMDKCKKQHHWGHSITPKNMLSKVFQ